MKTYDQGARTHGSGFSWRNTRQRIARWFDREREIITLRNVVGMMSEARQADADEYDAMAGALRNAKEEIRLLRLNLARLERQRT